ncbi:MAG: NAD(P)H-hydrate dehydratase [Chloroflexi bacterium]|nr:NAD(P)H-hydrate dehydratase [Chloroflexota bacterium]
MWKILSVAEMVAVEKEADAGGWRYAQMMEAAGKRLAEEVQIAYSHLRPRNVLGLVGSGNNGGDALVALAWLAGWGWKTTAVLLRPRSADDPLVTRLRQAGGELFAMETADEARRALAGRIAENTVILDGVLGTGFRLPLKPDLAELLGAVKAILAAHPRVHVVAVDCPSGVDCDSGEAAEQVLSAEMTVTMAAVKQGLLKLPAFALAGELRVVGIGLGAGETPAPQALERIQRFVVDGEWVKAALPARTLDAHKGTFGVAMIAAGSVNYTGAALLAGRAAYRSGAGLVTLAIPESLHAALAGHFPEATWVLLPEEDGAIAREADGVLWEALERATALLIGPGFGLSEGTAQFMAGFLSRAGGGKGKSGMGFVPPDAQPASRSAPPLVIDADGLKLLARQADWAQRLPAESILTPHPGEMSILCGMSTKEIQTQRLETAERFARQWGHIVTLKGAFTVISAPGGRTGIIPVASPALARAGSGDVLAGLIAGLRAQGMEAFSAAAAGAWIHAQAGLKAAQRLGSDTSVIAGDMIEGITEVFAELA